MKPFRTLKNGGRITTDGRIAYANIRVRELQRIEGGHTPLIEKPPYPKALKGKPRLTLVPTGIIWAIAKVREYGTKKYGDSDNWRKVEPKHYRDAAYRHWLKYIDDPSGKDEESGLPHLAHVACNIAFLIELEAGNVECDDMGGENKRKGGTYP